MARVMGSPLYQKICRRVQNHLIEPVCKLPWLQKVTKKLGFLTDSSLWGLEIPAKYLILQYNFRGTL